MPALVAESSPCFAAGMRIAADFIAARLGELLAMPPNARAAEWRRIHSEALEAGIITPLEGWPEAYSEDFCRCALQNIWWFTLDRLPPEMAADLDGLDDAARARLRETAEFVIAHLPGILPRPDRQEAWRALCADNPAVMAPQADDAPLVAMLAQAILIERHLRVPQTLH